MRSAGNVRWNSAASKEWVVDNGVQCGALLWIWREDLLNENLSLGGDGALRREFVLVVADTPGDQLAKGVMKKKDSSHL
jgi:hypothetical protein